MMRPVGIAAVLIGVLAIGAARAATLLDPNGDDTGYAPPSVALLSCEDGVARNVRKLVKCIGIRCHRKAAVAAVKLRGFAEEACENDCKQKYHELDFHIVGCDACLGPDARQMIADQAVQYLDDHNGDVFCDGTTPFGNDDTGYVSPSFSSLRCEQFVSKQVALSMACIYKCHVKGVDGAFGGGTFLDEQCEDRCRFKYERLNAGVDNDCPTCLKVDQRSAIFDNFESFIDSNNAQIYCAQ